MLITVGRALHDAKLLSDEELYTVRKTRQENSIVATQISKRKNLATETVLQSVWHVGWAVCIQVEDIVADCVEVMSTGGFVGDPVIGEVVKMVALSERIVGDMSFARQLRRKCQ